MNNTPLLVMFTLFLATSCVAQAQDRALKTSDLAPPKIERSLASAKEAAGDKPATTITATNVKATNVQVTGTLAAERVKASDVQVSGTVTATNVKASEVEVTGTLTAGRVKASDVQVSGTVKAANFVGDGSGLTGVTAAGLSAGTYSNQYSFTNPANQFNGTFTGTHSGSFSGTHTGSFAGTHTGTFNGTHSGDGSGLTGVFAAGLRPGTYPEAYKFPNPANEFTGRFTGNGAGLTSLTADALRAGTFTNVYRFSNSANNFTGTFSGNGSALTGVTSTATALGAGAYANQYSFPHAANQFAGMFTGTHSGTFAGTHTGQFTGDGSGLTGVPTTGLAAGTYANAYILNNAANRFTGTFSGDGSALANVTSTATALGAGFYPNQYGFSNTGNQFAGTFSGNGSGLTSVTATGLAAGTYQNAYILNNPANRINGTFTGDGSGLNNVRGTDATRWSLSGHAGLTNDHFLGTTDASPVNFRIGNHNALRLISHFTAFQNRVPNIVAGGEANLLEGENEGIVIAGGGTVGVGTQDGRHYAARGVRFSTISGGYANEVLGNYAGVGSGEINRASGHHSVVSGGKGNEAAGMNAGVAGGGGNLAGAEYAFVAGGLSNQALAPYSFAAGFQAVVLPSHSGAFVLAAGNNLGEFRSQAAGEFAVRAHGGVRFVTGVNSGAGVRVAANSGSWSTISDVHSKRDLEAVDGDTVLAAIARLPVWRWSYVGQADGIRHMGPTAQDFRAAFGLGEDDTSISVVDADGVSVAAIKALEARTATLTAQNAALREELARLHATQQAILARLDTLGTHPDPVIPQQP